MYRILYVDDESDLLDIGKLFLEGSGDFTVTTALSAAEALRLLEQEKFDAIISDYQMPGTDGIQFLVEVRTRFGQIPFILFTGRGREEIVIQAINSGANFYLQKGGEPGAQFAELSHKIHTAVENYQAGEKIQSLNKLYSVLSATNKAIISIRTKSAFFSEICRILVETGGFSMAWIGVADQERRIIRAIASAGHVDGYLDNINISTEDVPQGRGITGTAFRQGKYYFSNDIASDPRMEPWRENALKRGYLANAAFSFAIGTKNAGVISLYAPLTGFFDEQIIDLLDELAVDISFALKTIDEQDEREKAEKALKESEEKFHTLYQHMTEGAALHQLTYNEKGNPEDYVIIETNSAFERMLGISRDTVIGKTSRQAYGVAEPPYLEIYSRVALTGEPESFETYFPPLAKHFSISVYCPKKGRFATIFKDISDQKRAKEELFKKNEELNASYEQIAASEEELRANLDELARQERALRENEARLRAILDATPFPVALVDIQDNNINYWSRSALTIFGHTAPTAAEWYQLAYPDPVYRQDVIDRWKPYLEKAKLSGQPVNTGEYRVTCRDGSVRICELYATFLSDKLIVTFNDITERKRVEANLRASEDAHSAMLNGITESAFMITPEGIVLAANETVALRLGFKRVDELIGKNAFELLPEDAKKNRQIKIQKLLQSGQPVQFEDVRNGRVISQTIYPVKDPDGTVSRLAIFGNDITDRKRAEDALRESEQRFDLALEGTGAGLWDWDMENDRVVYSAQWKRMLGYKDHEVENSFSGWKNLWHPDDIANIEKALDDYLTGKTERYENIHRLRHKDGSWRWIVTRGGIVKDSTGKPVRWVGTNIDITERKKAQEALIRKTEDLHSAYEELTSSEEELRQNIEDLARSEQALRESEQRFDLALEGTGAGLWDWDMENDRVVYSAQWKLMLGYKDHEVENSFSGWKNLWHPDDITNIEKTLDDYLTGKTERYENIHRLRHKDGSWRWIVTRGGIVKDSTGKPVRWVGTNIDITGRKRMEEALRKSEEKYRNLFMTGADGIVVHDAQGRNIDANAQACEMLGYSHDELLTMRVSDLIPPEELQLKPPRLTDVMAGQPVCYERKLRRKDGTLLDVEIRASRVTEGKVQAFWRDITERKVAEQTIRHALAEKEVLLREIHHRVKNNLAGILSLIELQISSLSDPVQIAPFKELETRIRSMALVHESLSNSKDLARINFASYTENLTRHLLPAYGTAGEVKCKIEMGDITLPIETATPCGLVMNEIVTNSLKHAFPKTFNCREIHKEPCTITLTLHREGSDYLLGVSDNGIGMPEGIDVTISRTLGLFLIGFIVKHQLRGSTEVSTGNGTSYTIRFPEPAVKERYTNEKM